MLYLEIAIVVALVCVNGLLAMSELAIVSSRPARLKAIADEKVDLVVVLSHGGVERDKNGNWVGEDLNLAKASPDIDIIIGAHTHTNLPETLKAGNAVIVQTGSYGSNVGKLDITFNSARKPSVSYSLIPMDDKIDADAEIQQLIEDKYKDIRTPVAMCGRPRAA